jgi:NADH-quinone oxidoreductase subunit A
MSDLVAAAAVLGAGSTLVLVLYGLSLLLSHDPRPVVVEPLLSGHAPTEHAVSRYHPRWYAASIVFLAFDMEMAFMFPWALVVADMGTAAVVEMFGFLGVLFVGVVYAWREGAFRWA